LKTALRNTKIIVVVSIVLSCLSYFTTQKGWSEIYPFYFWKLYSQPAGWQQKYTAYRIYAKNENDPNWTRLKNDNRATFNRDETLYFLNPITNRIIESASKKDIQKLGVFCRYIAPEYSQHKVVAEVFNPLDLLEDENNYDTSTVIIIPQKR
jgi:hypothetical protein